MERVLLLRPLTGEILHPEVNWETGSDTQTLSAPGDITFHVPVDWLGRRDGANHPVFGKRQTLVVVERANKTIRNVGLVDDLDPQGSLLEVTCGGLSMLPANAGPWEGHQGYFVTMDTVTLFRRIYQWVQSYSNANLGIRVTGDSRSGSSVGYPGSARWQNANRDANRYRPELEKWENRVLSRERIEAQRKEAMFKAAGLRRVGDVQVTDNEPDDPGYKADSTLWVRESTGRAYRWRNGRWVSQSQADSAVKRWRDYQPTLQRAKDEVARLQYLLEPIEELLERYEDEAKEEFSLYYWQDQNLQTVIENLMEMGPFEYREHAAWDGERLDPQIVVGAPKVGTRRHNIYLQLGVNVEEPAPMSYGEEYTGVAMFGAGQGSEVLTAQRNWNPKHVVRNILVDNDNEAHTKSLVRAAANRKERETKQAAGLGFTSLVVYHDERCRDGSFGIGDEIPVSSTLPDGTSTTDWYRVLSITRPWGTRRSELEVEAV